MGENSLQMSKNPLEHLVSGNRTNRLSFPMNLGEIRGKFGDTTYRAG